MSNLDAWRYEKLLQVVEAQCESDAEYQVMVAGLPEGSLEARYAALAVATWNLVPELGASARATAALVAAVRHATDLGSDGSALAAALGRYDCSVMRRAVLDGREGLDTSIKLDAARSSS